MNADEGFTLSQVSTWELSNLSDLGRGDALIYTPYEATVTVQTWAWLLGSGNRGAEFERARSEVLSDGEIFAILHRPITEIMGWWRRLDWSEFSRDDDCGPDCLPEAWAWELSDRLRRVAGSLPANLARQLSTVGAVCRYVASQ